MALLAILLTVQVLISSPPSGPNDRESVDAAAMQALRSTALDQFTGTVTFALEMWLPAGMSPDAANGPRYVRQKWKILRASPGSIAVELRWEQGSNMAAPMMAGQTTQNMWLAMNGQLVALERGRVGSFRNGEHSTELETIGQLLTQGEEELAVILASGGYAKSWIPREITAPCSGPVDAPSLAFRINRQPVQVDFQRDRSRLLPISIAGKTSERTWHWRFAEYRVVDGIAYPSLIELVERRASDVGDTRIVYSSIQVSLDAPSDSLSRRCDVPSAQDAKRLGIGIRMRATGGGHEIMDR